MTDKMIEVCQGSIDKSPDRKGYVRLSACVKYWNMHVEPEDYWFEFPEDEGLMISESGNPWLACLIPLAATFGATLRINRPVDFLLYQNVQELMHIWTCWYPHLRKVPVDADVSHDTTQNSQKGASFFSGGIDSFFTLLRHLTTERSGHDHGIDDLLCVHGFDIPLGDSDAFQRMEDKLRFAALRCGKRLVVARTNLKENLWRKTDWGYLSHNCALASVALSLERHYSRILIASTHHYGDLQFWGSHPLTDPLLSTSTTKIVHDGAGFSRAEKTRTVATSRIARDALRVCWKSQSDRNCCSCNKCYRTMTTLEILGVLSDCATFEKRFDIKKIRNIYSETENDRSFMREVQELALQNARPDIADEIARSLAHSHRLTRYLRLARRIRGTKRLRKFGSFLEQKLLLNCIE